MQEGEGDAIATWEDWSGSLRGEARVGADAAVGPARAEAERAVEDNRAPRRYHRAIRDYFGGSDDAGSGGAGDAAE